MPATHRQSILGTGAISARGCQRVRSTPYARTGDEGTTCIFHFCPACGVTVYYEPQAMPGFVSIPVGAFADPHFPPPTISVYESRMHAWVTPPLEAEHLA
ncbi:GFA family protein [Dyella sp. Sa]|uniref:GFA family protein n=1 Tax=Dyella lutea TaxID=2950441 RepID=A0ABT1FFD6_9GAMM|nr:GFA family protein [Dyella lutea]